MYDVLDLYEEDYDPKRPIVCLDEKPKQLIEDKITPILMKPGSPEKYDYEYIRNGTANICQRRFNFPQFGRFKFPHLQI